MEEEIKKIIDRLEMIDHKENCCGFEFADSGTFDETCRCFEERKKMAAYIVKTEKQLDTSIKINNMKTIAVSNLSKRIHNALSELDTLRTYINSLSPSNQNVINKQIDNIENALIDARSSRKREVI